MRVTKTTRWMATWAAAAMTVSGAAMPPAAAQPPEPVRELVAGAVVADTTRALPRRISGADRFETSAKVARHAAGVWSGGRLRIVRGDRPLDAAASPGGPVLYVPASGPLPRSVTETYRAVAPVTVRVIGDERTVPERQVAGLRGSYDTERVALPTDALSLQSTAEAFWVEEQIIAADGLDVVAPGPVAEVAAALANTPYPAVVLPASGSLAGLEQSMFSVFTEGETRLVGAAARFSAARQQQITRQFQAYGTTPQVRRLAGADRYETAALTAREGFPLGASRVYVVGGHADADAALGSAVSDGPVVLVPRCGALPDSVAEAIGAIAPREVVAIGGAGVVCDDMVRQAAAASTPVPRRSAQRASMSRGAQCVVSSGRVWCREDGSMVELAGPGDVVSVRSVGYGSAARVYVLTAGGELWRWSAYQGFGAAERVEGSPDGIVALAEGDGEPCAITPRGVSCLLDSGWVVLPVGAPEQVALHGASGRRVVATLNGGTTRIWRVDDEGSVTMLSARGVPSRVAEVAVPSVVRVRMRDAAGTVWDFTPTGEFAGRLERHRVTMDALAPTTRCGVQAGTRVVCTDWGNRAWTAPPGTRIVDVAGEEWGWPLWVVLDDGRVVVLAARAGVLRGFGG